jgi:2-dehydropantoate 2-reductase
MNIVILGAGAIGSLFGAFLSKKNDVLLIGRSSHVNAINQNGLTIEGKTQLNVKIRAVDSVNKISFSPDLLIITVKSYDTESAIKEVKSNIGDNTIVMSLQNGLDNLEKIGKYVSREKIIACTTTHGVVFSKPGIIKHTGIGKTVLGPLTGRNIQNAESIANMLSDVGIKTTVNDDIIKEIWIKAIVNSSINPLTALFNCKNGYLLKNPVLENILEKTCEESTSVANAYGIDVTPSSMIRKTKEVVKETYENHSSMLQSILQGKKTEIESINSKIVEVGRKHNIKTLMNEILIYSIESIGGD